MTTNTEGEPRFDPDTVIERAIGVDSAEVGEDTVLVDSLRGKALRLNSTGTAIWRKLGARPTFAELVSALADAFPVSPEDAEEALRAYVLDLLDQGLIGTSRAVRVIKEERNPS